jgi:uncharacterized protein
MERLLSRMRLIPSLAGLLVAWLLLFVGPLRATEVPVLQGRVNDYAHVLGADAGAIEATLAANEQRTGEQVVVLTVSSLNGQDIESYANDVFAQWKLGQKGKDNGVLMVVAVDDHRMRIEVGYGLEGTLTDLDSSRIIRERMQPRFADGDYAGGVQAGVDGVLAVLSGEPLAPPPPAAASPAPIWVYIFVFFMLTLFSLVAASGGGLLTLWVTPGCSIFLFVLMSWQFALGVFFAYMGGVLGLRWWWMRKAYRRRGRKGQRRKARVLSWPPTLWQVLTWNGAWESGGKGGGGRSGGGWSGSSSSSSSSSSSYSGGGGSSGGGGASGSW